MKTRVINLLNSLDVDNKDYQLLCELENAKIIIECMPDNLWEFLDVNSRVDEKDEPTKIVKKIISMFCEFLTVYYSYSVKYYIQDVEEKIKLNDAYEQYRSYIKDTENE